MGGRMKDVCPSHLAAFYAERYLKTNHRKRETDFHLSRLIHLLESHPTATAGSMLKVYRDWFTSSEA